MVIVPNSNRFQKLNSDDNNLKVRWIDFRKGQQNIKCFNSKGNTEKASFEARLYSRVYDPLQRLLAQSYLYWPWIGQEIEGMVESCTSFVEITNW